MTNIHELERLELWRVLYNQRETANNNKKMRHSCAFFCRWWSGRRRWYIINVEWNHYNQFERKSWNLANKRVEEKEEDDDEEAGKATLVGRALRCHKINLLYAMIKAIVLVAIVVISLMISTLLSGRSPPLLFTIYHFIYALMRVRANRFTAMELKKTTTMKGDVEFVLFLHSFYMFSSFFVIIFAQWRGENDRPKFPRGDFGVIFLPIYKRETGPQENSK